MCARRRNGVISQHTSGCRHKGNTRSCARRSHVQPHRCHDDAQRALRGAGPCCSRMQPVHMCDDPKTQAHALLAHHSSSTVPHHTRNIDWLRTHAMQSPRGATTCAGVVPRCERHNHTPPTMSVPRCGRQTRYCRHRPTPGGAARRHADWFGSISRRAHHWGAQPAGATSSHEAYRHDMIEHSMGAALYHEHHVAASQQQ